MKKSRKKRISALAMAGILVVTLAGCGKNSNSTLGYQEEQVKLRDVVNYHSFTGTISPVTEKNVLPEVNGCKVETIYVKEGQEVHEGDVLMTMDADSIEEKIAELEATINAADKSSAASISSAQQTYNSYQQNLNDGLDSSVQGAKTTMDNAYSSLVTAQQKYNDEVNLNNQQMSSSIMSAKQSVDSALSQLQNAQSSLDSAQLQLTQAKENKQLAEKNGKTGDELKQYDQDIAQKEQAVNAAQTTVSNQETLYNDAVNAYEAAKVGEENSLTSLYDALIQAQSAYVNAVDAYNTAVRSSETQLQTYANNVQSAQANSSSQDANKVQLQNLKDQLEDCDVKAPMDGVVTTVNVKEGDYVYTSTGNASASMVITNFDTMKIEVKINEYDIQGVEEGKAVDVNVSALDKTYKGTFKSISKVATVDNGVSYFKAEVDFDGDEDARSGMSAEVRLTISEADNATSVTAKHIQTADDGSAYVYVYENDKKNSWKEQPVTLGVSDGTYTEITEGLYPGDTILYKPDTTSIESLMGGEE